MRWRDGVFEDVAPSVRSRVYEYGGRAFAVRDGRVTVEADGSTGDHFLTADHDLFTVVEDGDSAAIARNGAVVRSERDFYAAPRVSDDGRLAYLCWDAPDMPWDAAELWVDGAHVAGGNGVSAMQPGWLSDGSLVWIDDRTGWWNLYRDGHPIHPLDAEVGYPAWQLGFQNWCELADRRLAYTARHGGFDHLFIDGQKVDQPFTELQFLVPFKDGIASIAGGPSDPPSLIAIEPGGAHEVLRAGLTIDLGEVTRPEHISFGGAHALLYAPGPVDALVVRCHGGPTAHASSAFDPEVQFFTSRGFAVADVNYRGSTGYGRAFRDSLKGQWGVADVEDCVACVEHLNPSRAIIRGSSAGGYTTLRALTTTDAFRAGSCRYGIGDLVALNAATHRFEAHYTDWLIGTDPALLRERSPVEHLDGFNAPVILFQGLDDKVVPPAQARAMAAALEAKGLDHELHLYEGEGHGFRRAATRQAVLEAELAFFRRAIGSPAS